MSYETSKSRRGARERDRACLRGAGSPTRFRSRAEFCYFFGFPVSFSPVESPARRKNTSAISFAAPRGLARVNVARLPRSPLAPLARVRSVLMSCAVCDTRRYIVPDARLSVCYTGCSKVIQRSYSDDSVPNDLKLLKELLSLTTIVENFYFWIKIYFD